MYQVQKRNGKNIDFNLSKISDAIKMAFEAQEKQYNQSIIDFIALKVTADFEPKIKEGLVSVEDIQDSVESVLVQAGYADVAKAYILYRRQREKLRNTESTILDFKKTVDDYVAKAVGISNQRSFQRVFKNFTGYSAAEYRKIIIKNKGFK